MCNSNVKNKTFDDVDRMGCIVHAVQSLKGKHMLVSDRFEECGLLIGYNDMKYNFSLCKFSVGSTMRDINLLQVNNS